MITSIYTVFIILSNTVIQFLISKKDIKTFVLIWFRDAVSGGMFIYLGMSWQLYIVAWQFIMTYTGYLCWRHEEKTGEKISQIHLIKTFFKN